MENQEQSKREKALADAKLYMANGWELKAETPEYFLLTRNKQSTGVHILLAIIFWWLCFVPNLIYYFMSKQTKKILK